METKPLIRLTLKQGMFHTVAKGMFAVSASYFAQGCAGLLYDKVVMHRYIVHEPLTGK